MQAPMKHAGLPIIIALAALLYPYLRANPVPTVTIVLGMKISSQTI